MTTPHSLPLLERITVASPCPARWDDMTGDEKSRHCAQCNLKVHNLSAMTREEAEALLTGSLDGRLCIRLYRRADGTILTQNCPVGFAAARAHLRRVGRRIAAAFGLVGASTLAAASTANSLDGDAPVRLCAFRPFSVLAEWLAPSPPPPPSNAPPGGWVAGSRCFIPPTPTVPSPTLTTAIGSR